MTPSPALPVPSAAAAAPSDAPARSEVRPWRGIFARVLAFGLAVSLLPIAGLGYLLIDLNARALKQSTAGLRLAVIEDARRAIRAELSRVDGELTGMGQLLLAPGLGDDDRRLALVGAKITASDVFDHVTIYDVQGHLAGTVKARETATPSHPSELDAAVKEQAAAGRLVPWQLRSEEKEPLLDVLRAVQVDGVIRGYLATTIRLSHLCSILGDLAQRGLLSASGLYVVDEARRLVLAGDPAKAATRQNRSGQGIFLVAVGNASFENDFTASPEEPYLEDGERMVGSIATLPELHWAVVARQPRDLAYASLDHMRRTVLLAFIFAGLAALVIAALIARRLTRPIAQLSDATHAIATRQFSGLPEALASRGDELGVLCRSFTTMASDLAQSEARLVEETRVRSSLSRYLAPDVVDLIVKDPHRLRLSGERREVTILFADVVAFTKLAENRSPEETVALLNELFTVATEIVQKHGGIVDKFIGDCVMAVWGAPEAHDDDPVRALSAADDLRRWLDTANRRWRSKFGTEIKLAMGIHTGTVVAGNLGSEKRMEYTVIGDAVNVAARLEGIAQPGQILISEATRERIGDAFETQAAGERPIAGRSKAELLYEVLE